jgi:hypothetical protein
MRKAAAAPLASRVREATLAPRRTARAGFDGGEQPSRAERPARAGLGRVPARMAAVMPASRSPSPAGVGTGGWSSAPGEEKGPTRARRADRRIRTCASGRGRGGGRARRRRRTRASGRGWWPCPRRARCRCCSCHGIGSRARASRLVAAAGAAAVAVVVLFGGTLVRLRHGQRSCCWRCCVVFCPASPRRPRPAGGRPSPLERSIPGRDARRAALNAPVAVTRPPRFSKAAPVQARVAAESADAPARCRGRTTGRCALGIATNALI